MKKPEVLMLVTGSLFEQVFRSEALEKLDSFTETIIPAEKGAEWKEFLPTAEGIITSWGSLNEMTEEVLDQAPELKIIGHAAGKRQNMHQTRNSTRDYRSELPSHECGSFLLRRRALLHRFSTSVNSGCSSPTTQRFGSSDQRKTVAKCADYFGIGFTQQP